ncbi:TolB family protein [candidate division KSB1 bacterium]
MKSFLLLTLIAALIIINGNDYSASAQDRQDFTALTGEYLGQKPPGPAPELFAPGIISVEENFEHSAAVFSPDKKEVFWCTNVKMYTDKRIIGNLRLYYMKMIDGKWTSPRPAPFTNNIRVERPVFSPDGSRLYIEYGSNPNYESDTDIYVVERTGEGWSDPVPVSPMINSPAWERLHCVTADGSLYFTRDLLTRNEEIFISRFVDGEFTEPEKLGKSYNSDAAEIVILIAPDEHYMLICQKNEQHSSDLYICYKKPDGTWTERIKTPYYCGGFLALSPDGKYLFLLNEGICWVDTSFIEALKPDELKENQ